MQDTVCRPYFAPFQGVQIPTSLKRDGGLASIIWTYGVDVDVDQPAANVRSNNVTMAGHICLKAVLNFLANECRIHDHGLRLDQSFGSCTA
jgi:hypothetical protein